MLNGVATGLYIGARLGPGPRDGLMTGFVALRPGRSIRLVRTVIEVSVLAVGWLLGGKVGLGTVLYAVTIGPLAHLFIPMFTVAPTARRNRRRPTSPSRRRAEPGRTRSRPSVGPSPTGPAERGPGVAAVPVEPARPRPGLRRPVAEDRRKRAVDRPMWT